MEKWTVVGKKKHIKGSRPVTTVEPPDNSTDRVEPHGSAEPRGVTVSDRSRHVPIESHPNNGSESQDVRQCGTRFHFRKKAATPAVLPKEGWVSRRSVHSTPHRSVPWEDRRSSHPSFGSTRRAFPIGVYDRRSVVPIKQEWWGFADGKRVWAIELSNGRCILSTEKKYAAWLRRLGCE